MLVTGDRISCSIIGERKKITDCIVEIYLDEDGDQSLCLHNTQYDNSDEWYEDDARNIGNYTGYDKRYNLGYFNDIEDEIKDVLVLGKYSDKEVFTNIKPPRELLLSKDIGQYKKGKYLIVSKDDVEVLLKYGASYVQEWNPSMLWVNDVYYYIDTDGVVKNCKYDMSVKNQWRVKTGNCFETKMKAEIYQQRVLEGGIEL